MSQDLFASFFEDSSSQIGSKIHHGDPISGNSNPWAVHDNPVWQKPQASTVAATAGQDDDDDDFGDFEDASAPVSTSTAKQINSPVTIRSSTSKPSDGHQGPFPPKAPSRSTTPTAPSTMPAKKEKMGQHPFAGHMDLLFDAGDDEYDAGADELGDLSTNPEAAMAYSKRIIAEQEAALARANPIEPSKQDDHPTPIPKPKTMVGGLANNSNHKTAYAPRKDPNVLFDADDVSDEDDDEFGGFETWNEGNSEASTVISPPAQPRVQSSMPAMDLLGLDDTLQFEHPSGTNGQPPRHEGSAVLTNADVTNLPNPWSEQADFDNDAWDDFETAAPKGALSNVVPGSTLPRAPQTISTTHGPSTTKDDALPPTNVPPPAVLISLFPSIISEADSALFNALGKLDIKQRQMLLSHPASHQFLKGYLNHCRVMAHIIAGRKSRWKRDQRLSQSMSIGPAAAGGRGGMKLTGLDKAENAKEEREVLDVLRLWQGQVGKLRTAVAAASSAPGGPKLPSVPEIAEQMPVKSLKALEGGVTAAHACALCGLKREERVGRVDVEVDDSFGEWWVQSMSMHLSCREFWEEFEKKLKSR